MVCAFSDAATSKEVVYEDIATFWALAVEWSIKFGTLIEPSDAAQSTAASHVQSFSKGRREPIET
jgi:hypothetical protein